MLGRIVRPDDFQRVLGRPPRARSAHFAVHYLRDIPSRPPRKVTHQELSTDGEQTCAQPVDDRLSFDAGEHSLSRAALPPAAVPSACWLGMVVPKRHAKRSVTRTLVKRQIRATFSAADAAEVPAGLPPGLWVVRLRAPIDRAKFPSAASTALRDVVRDELRDVWRQAVRRGRHG